MGGQLVYQITLLVLQFKRNLQVLYLFLRDMDDISEELLDIMRDGVIDDTERLKVDEIIKTLDSVARIIDEIKRKMNL